MERRIRLTEQDLHNIVSESVRMILSEKFASKKLDRMAREHGGLKKEYNGGRYDGIDVYAREYPVPASELTDDMLGDEVLDNSEYLHDNAVNFNDGTHLPINNVEGAWNLRRNFKQRAREKGRYPVYPFDQMDDGYHSPTERAHVARMTRKYKDLR